MNNITDQDCQDIVDIWSDLNNQLIMAANDNSTPIQEHINAIHQKKINAFQLWLKMHNSKTLDVKF